MKYYLSVDGGGTKTAYLLTDTAGRVVGENVTLGCTYSVMGTEKVWEILKEGYVLLLKKCGVSSEDITYTVWGISCYGEYSQYDVYLNHALPRLFPDSCGCYPCNDVEIGLSGSLLMRSGVHIVAGTGAIVMGKNAEGIKARANGWHEAFSDEGSAHWLGMKALSLFTKQADLREERSYLYDLMLDNMKLDVDMDIVRFYEGHLKGSRDKIASLQKILLEAAGKGDLSAVRLYEEAAQELAGSVAGVVRQLDMRQEMFNVSYYGGAFKAGTFLINPLKKYLQKQGLLLISPELSPLCGGILMAAKACGADITGMKVIINNLKAYEVKNQREKSEYEKIHTDLYGWS